MAGDCYEIMPDSFTGAIIAIEGIRDAAVLLNGPTGCKFYHGAVSENQMPRADLLDPLYYSEEFYFGQPRVPVTYLDDYDYVFGATEKLEKILPVVARKGHGLIVVINSPGAALIGDDLLRFINNADLPVPCIAMENTGFSQPLFSGFQSAVMAVLSGISVRQPEKVHCVRPPEKGLLLQEDGPSGLQEKIVQLPEKGALQQEKRAWLPQKRKKYVNLMGISIFHHHWQGNVAELTDLLSTCGITVNTTICAGCTLSDLENMVKAQLNVVVHAEYADALVPFMAERFNMESFVPPGGAPVGFEATASWITGVCDQLDVDPAPALGWIKCARQKSHGALNRFNALTGLPKGATFAVDADASLALPLVTWLYNYLGMVPVSVRVNAGVPATLDKIKAFLHKIDCDGAWQAEVGQGAPPDVVFGNGAVIARYRLSGRPFTGIEISLPAGTYQHVIPKTYMGPQGCLYLIELIINGLASGC